MSEPVLVPSVANNGLTVLVEDSSGFSPPLEIERWADVALQTLSGEGAEVGQLGLNFVNEETIQQLNSVHMGSQKPTDVLAFPIDADGVPYGLEFASTDFDGADFDGVDFDGADPPPETLLGDVIVCPHVARAQASEHAGTLDAELALLVAHGVLHVLGHDHSEPDETSLMKSRERLVLGKLGFTHPG